MKDKQEMSCGNGDWTLYSEQIPDAIQIGDETQPRTLYVGNLDAQMTEEFLVVLFSQIGPVKGCKIIHEVSKPVFLSSQPPQNASMLSQLSTCDIFSPINYSLD